jgi:hypothetical protein
MFFLIGIALFGIGLLGEYIGRIYQQVRHRPRYLVEAVLEQQEKGKATRERSRTKAAVEAVAGEPDPFVAEPKKKKPKPADTEHPSLFSDSQE